MTIDVFVVMLAITDNDDRKRNQTIHRFAAAPAEKVDDS
jgi:hypothetical protein